MLGGEKVEHLDEFVAHGLNFRSDFLDRHFVEGFDRYTGVFLAVFDDHNSSVRFQRPPHVFHRFFRLGKLVVDIHQQHQVHLPSWEAGVVRAGQNRIDIRDLPLAKVFDQQIEHPPLDIDSNHATLGTDLLGKPPCEIADAGAQIEALARALYIA